MVFHAEIREPEKAQLGEQFAFVRNAIGHDPVESADTVGTHDKQ
jgi:hypothetical protein